MSQAKDAQDTSIKDDSVFPGVRGEGRHPCQPALGHFKFDNVSLFEGAAASSPGLWWTMGGNDFILWVWILAPHPLHSSTHQGLGRYTTQSGSGQGLSLRSQERKNIFLLGWDSGLWSPLTRQESVPPSHKD